MRRKLLIGVDRRSSAADPCFHGFHATANSGQVTGDRTRGRVPAVCVPSGAAAEVGGVGAERFLGAGCGGGGGRGGGRGIPQGFGEGTSSFGLDSGSGG